MNVVLFIKDIARKDRSNSRNERGDAQGGRTRREKFQRVRGATENVRNRKSWPQRAAQNKKHLRV